MDGDFYIFAESNSEIFIKNKIPNNVLQFMATVESVTDDFLTVTVLGEISERFGNIIQTGKTYRVNRDAYNPGIYTEEPLSGSMVIVACKNEIDVKASKADVEKAIADAGAEVVGYIDLTNDYQIEFKDNKTLKELEEIASHLESYNFIDMVTLNYAYEIGIN